MTIGVYKGFHKPSGKWQVWTEEKDPQTGKRVKKSHGYFPLEAQAFEAIESIRALLKLPQQRTKPHPFKPEGSAETLLTIADGFFKEREALHYRDVDNQRSLYKHWIADNKDLCIISLNLLTKADCQRWLNWLEAEPQKKGKGAKRLSARTVRNARNVLAAMLDYGIKKGHLTDNPSVGLVYRSEDRNKSEIVKNVLAKEEIERLLSEPSILPDHRTLYRFAIYTGLRSGELSTLHLSDVHLTDRKPYVYVRFGGFEGGQFTPTKTKKTRRVPLLKEAVQAVRAQLASLPPKATLLFPSTEGKVRVESYYSPTFKRDLAKIGVTEAEGGLFPGLPFDFHSCRRTCATGLTAGFFGRVWSLEETQSMLGHASRSTTEIYARYGTTLAERAAALHADDERQPTGGQATPPISPQVRASDDRPLVSEISGDSVAT